MNIDELDPDVFEEAAEQLCLHYAGWPECICGALYNVLHDPCDSSEANWNHIGPYIDYCARFFKPKGLSGAYWWPIWSHDLNREARIIACLLTAEFLREEQARAAMLPTLRSIWSFITHIPAAIWTAIAGARDEQRKEND